MTENNCLICNSSSHPPPNTNTSDILAPQLRAIFLLRNIFELPSWTLQKYLISSCGGDNPSQWVSLCRECDLLVRKTRSFYDQFVKAERKFRRMKYELVRKMKESTASPITLSPRLPLGFTISDECRQFVRHHDYAEPPKNPFQEGDHGALNLLGVAVAADFDVATLNVKTEVFDSIEYAIEEENVPEFDHQYHTDMDFGCSQDLSFTPEGHDYDESDDGGDGSCYHDHDDEDDDDDYIGPPAPKCRKREAKVKSENSITNNDSEARSDEITAAEASNLIQFLTTSRGKRMVRYDGHNFYNGSNHPGRRPNYTGVTHFYCKWRRRHGCPARITFRNYKDEDASYTGFMPNLEPHEHTTAAIGRDKTMDPIWYEVNALTKEIVKDNLNAPTMQVIQMVQDSFVGDPEVTQELSKENVKNNLRSVIVNTKRRLGWKPGTNGHVMGQALMGDRSQPGVKTNLIPSETEMKEITSAEASTLIQFLTTSRGKRMVRYDGHNFHNGTNYSRRSSSSGLTYFYCQWRRHHGCPAKVVLRNYNDEDATYTGFVANLEPHDHSAARNGGDTKDPIWYEVNALAKEIVKDNVNAPAGQVIRMVQDSFMGDPDVTQELSKENVKNNLRKLVLNMKRKLGWKPDPNAYLKRERMSRKRKRGVAIDNVH